VGAIVGSQKIYVEYDFTPKAVNVIREIVDIEGDPYDG
jgi:hypothetical protein